MAFDEWNESTQEKVLSWTVIFLCLVSCACCACVCVFIRASGISPCSLCKNSLRYVVCLVPFSSGDRDINLEEQRFEPTKLSTDVTTDIIYWMCVADFFHCIQTIFSQLPNALGFPEWHHIPCLILCISGQFLTAMWVCFHCVLAILLCVLLSSRNSLYRIQNITKYKIFIYMLILILSTLSAVVPIIGENQYNTMPTDKLYYEEYWIPNKSYLLIYVIAISCSIAFHFAIIVVAICKWSTLLSGQINTYYYSVAVSMIYKLCRFVVAYFIIRIFSVIFRIWQYRIWNKTPVTPPFWITYLHFIGLSSVGIADCIVYYVNQRAQPHIQVTAPNEQEAAPVADPLIKVTLPDKARSNKSKPEHPEEKYESESDKHYRLLRTASGTWQSNLSVNLNKKATRKSTGVSSENSIND